MSAQNNQSKFQNTAFLLVDIQIMIDFYALTWWEKDAFKLGNSLAALNLRLKRLGKSLLFV